MGMQVLGNRLALAAMRIRKNSMNQSPAVVVYSRYPVLYAEPFSNPRERNLGHLFEALHGYGQVWQVVLLNLWPWQMLRHYFEIRDAFSRARIVPLLLLNSIWELLVSFSGLTLLAPFWKYRRLRPELEAHFGDWDVGPAWRSEVDRSLTGLELLTNLSLILAMRRLAQVYHPRVVIHPSEFQPMERAIWAGVKGTETRSVALQHTTVSSNTLMYFFAENEIREAITGKDKFATPLPDYYLTTGDWPLEIMRDAGYPAARSAVVGAVRYNDLRVEAWSDEEKAGIRSRLGLPPNGMIVLVTTSSDRPDSMALLESLSEAIAHLPAPITFLFKSHYHCRVETEVEKLFVSLAPEHRRVIDVDADLHSYLRASNAVVVTNSTTGLEAIALGCPPVVFDNCAILNIGPLGDLRDAALFAFTPESLAEAIKEALDPAAVERLRRVWPLALARTFHALDGQALTRFVDFLKAKGLL
jgi:surface carbohydrate biosynthesis protein (TIGR04326 family)